MDKDHEFREVVEEFYREYRILQEHMECRMNSHFGIGTENYIEIWEYHRIKKGKLLLKVKMQEDAEDPDIECYRRAAKLIRNMIREQEKKGETHGRVYTDHSERMDTVEGGYQEKAG